MGQSTPGGISNVVEERNNFSIIEIEHNMNMLVATGTNVICFYALISHHCHAFLWWWLERSLNSDNQKGSVGKCWYRASSEETISANFDCNVLHYRQRYIVADVAWQRILFYLIQAIWYHRISWLQLTQLILTTCYPSQLTQPFSMMAGQPLWFR